MIHPTDDELEAMAVRLEDRCDSGEIAHQLEAAAMLRACKGRVRVDREKIARALFVQSRPSNMVPRDWDSGAELGAGNAYRDKIYRIADAAIAALDIAPDQSDWNAAIEAAMDACTNVIKSYDVMDATGTKYLPMKTQKAAKGMVSIAREDIGKLKKGQTND